MKKTAFILGLVLLVVLGFIFSLPAPIDNDLNKIGQGKPSVVFVYDPNRVVSNQQALEFNKAQDILGENINLLIARTGYPETQAFREQFQADIAEVLFFNESGALISRTFAPVDAEALARFSQSKR